MRRVLAFASWVLLLLCVATLGLWVRSYFAVDVIKHQWVPSRPNLHSYMALGSGGRGVMTFEFQYIHRWLDTVGGPLVERQRRFNRLRSSVLADRDVVNSGGFWVSRPVRPSTSQSGSATQWRWSYIPAQSTDASAWTLMVSVPHWFVALLFTLGALALTLAKCAIGALRRMLLRLTRGNSSSCLACGYNLTGNTSGVCPECGTPTREELPIKSN